MGSDKSGNVPRLFVYTLINAVTSQVVNNGFTESKPARHTLRGAILPISSPIGYLGPDPSHN